jgi:hypothetical protein
MESRQHGKFVKKNGDTELQSINQPPIIKAKPNYRTKGTVHETTNQLCYKIKIINTGVKII